MAAVFDDLETRLDLVGLGGYVGGLRNAASAVGLLSDKLDEASSKHVAYGIAAGAVATGIAVAIGRSVQAAGDLQQVEAGFKTMLGSAEAARAKVEELQDFAKRTPFDFNQTAKGAQQLLAMGVSADKLLPTLEAVGNATAAAGGNTEDFMGALRAIGQIQTKGKINSEELIQLAERGVPALDVLRDELGLTQEQMRDFNSLNLTAEQGLEALRKGFNKRYGNAMVEQSKTLNGAVSNLNDSVKQLQQGFGGPLLGAATGTVRAITGVVEAVNALPAPAKAAFGYLGVGAVVALGAFAATLGWSALQAARLAGENAKLTNEQLKAAKSTDAYTKELLEEAAAHDRAAGAAGRHAAALGKANGGGAAGTGLRVVDGGASGGAAGLGGKIAKQTGRFGKLGGTLSGTLGKAGGFLAKGAKWAGRLNPYAFAAAVGGELALSMLPNEGNVGMFKRISQGALAGAGTGALIGTAVPGVGNIAGGIAGAVIGGGAAALGQPVEAKAAEKPQAKTDPTAEALKEQNELLRKQLGVLEQIRSKDGVLPFTEVSRAQQLQGLARTFG